MKKEILYYFGAPPASAELIDELMRLKNAGDHFGFTFPADRTHTCFNSAQEEKLKGVLAPRLNRGLTFERTEYYRGNLAGEDFGINTFKEPLVQWCPVPIASASTGVVFDNQEPWGLTTNNSIVLPAKLHDLVSQAVGGLEPRDSDLDDNFRVYSIRQTGVHVPEDVDYTQQPLIVDGRDLTLRSCDIWKCENGAIVCTNRFADLLNSFWDGLPDIKFQPIRCEHLDHGAARMFEQPLKWKGTGANLMVSGLRDIENALNLRFPKYYVSFIERYSEALPHGWLSPAGGTKSALVRTLEQERTEASPAMPHGLIPVFAYGNGDYACLQEKHTDGKEPALVDWLHESGTTRPSSLKME